MQVLLRVIFALQSLPLREVYPHSRLGATGQDSNSATLRHLLAILTAKSIQSNSFYVLPQRLSTISQG